MIVGCFFFQVFFFLSPSHPPRTGFTLYIPFVFWRTFANANGVSLPKLLGQLCCAWDHMAEDPERHSMMRDIVAETRKLLGYRSRSAPSTFRQGYFVWMDRFFPLFQY